MLSLMAFTVIWLLLFMGYVWAQLWQRWPWIPGHIRGILKYQSYQPALLARNHQFIGVPVRCPLRFTIRREGRMDRMAIFLRLATEFQTGDPAFDEQLYVVCDDADWCIMLEESPELRDVILLLFTHPTIELTLRSKCLYARLHKRWEYQYVKTTEIVDCLTAIADAISTRSVEPTLNSSYRFQGALFSAFHFASLICGAGFSYPIFQGEDHLLEGKEGLLWFALKTGGVLLLLWLAAIRLVMQGSSRGADVFRHFVRYGMVGLLLSLWCGIYLWNCADDDASTENRVVVITPYNNPDDPRQARRSAANGQTFIVYIEGLQPGQYRYRIDVSPAQANEMMRQRRQYPDRVFFGEMKLHAGRLGFPWIESFHLDLQNQ